MSLFSASYRKNIIDTFEVWEGYNFCPVPKPPIPGIRPIICIMASPLCRTWCWPQFTKQIWSLFIQYGALLMRYLNHYGDLLMHYGSLLINHCAILIHFGVLFSSIMAFLYICSAEAPHCSYMWSKNRYCGFGQHIYYMYEHAWSSYNDSMYHSILNSTANHQSAIYVELSAGRSLWVLHRYASSMHCPCLHRILCPWYMRSLFNSAISIGIYL